KSIHGQRATFGLSSFRSAQQQETIRYDHANVFSEQSGGGIEIGQIAMHQNAALAFRHILAGEWVHSSGAYPMWPRFDCRLLRIAVVVELGAELGHAVHIRAPSGCHAEIMLQHFIELYCAKFA